VTIVCLKCDLVFRQTPNAHLAGNNCPRCAQMPRWQSIKEKTWLNSLNIPENNRQKHIPGFRYSVDALVDRTVYEFYGTYWHGDPRTYESSTWNERCQMTMGELYERTCERERRLRSAGYDVRCVWEQDWDAGATFSPARLELPLESTQANVATCLA
jgi:G:T-mismatch repair DNA endonuclease (very short patch repair protein)